MVLHTINKVAALDMCRGLIGPDDLVVLIEDGVYLALSELLFRTYALEDDLLARGLQHRNLKSVKLIGYQKFVELSVKAEKICSWF